MAISIRVAIRDARCADESLIRRKIADVTWSVYASSSYLERQLKVGHVNIQVM